MHCINVPLTDSNLSFVLIILFFLVMSDALTVFVQF